MFGIEQDRLIENLYILRERLCCYMCQPCDCKYGANQLNDNEQTGCPEVTMLIRILKKMTDEEYSKLCQEAGIV